MGNKSLFTFRHDYYLCTDKDKLGLNVNYISSLDCWVNRENEKEMFSPCSSNANPNNLGL